MPARCPQRTPRRDEVLNHSKVLNTHLPPCAKIWRRYGSGRARPRNNCCNSFRTGVAGRGQRHRSAKGFLHARLALLRVRQAFGIGVARPERTHKKARMKRAFFAPRVSGGLPSVQTRGYKPAATPPGLFDLGFLVNHVLRATGSNFLIQFFSGLVRLFLVVV